IDRSVLHVCADHNQIYISHDGHGHHLKDKLAGERLGTDAASGGNVPAPMHGVILDLFVSAGQKVEKGTRLAVLEAMKMQHDIVAAQAGEISEILCEKGKQVASGALLFKVAATESPEVAA